MSVLRRGTVRGTLIASFFAIAVVGAVPCVLHLWSAGRPVEPFFSGLGSHTRKITTDSPAAQKYFDQGLAFLFAYNYDESVRSFEAAAASDPHCAMAQWGIAMANGGKIDDPQAYMARARVAWGAAKKARELAEGASPVEQALIQAVDKRYGMPPSSPIDRRPLDEAYAAAMRRAWAAFPDDADVGALTAEAILRGGSPDVCQSPGRPLPTSAEALRTLDAVLAKSPHHPYALHVLIHAVEGTDHPERGEAAAEFLRGYAPGLSHLSHMPTHLDIRRGRWQEAVLASERAIAADTAYAQVVPDPGHYRILMIHNNQMLAYAAAMQGQSAKATETVQQMLAGIPQEYVASDVGRVDYLFALPYQLHLRFGRMKAMLAEPPPRPDLPVANATYHWARATACAAGGQFEEAKYEQAVFLAVVRSFPPPLRVLFRKNDARTMFRIAAAALAGQMLYQQGKRDEGISQLRYATEGEDSLAYVEPPEFVQPVRHVLGAALIDAGRNPEAEAVYREDLVRHPENGWSLYGLAKSLRNQKKIAEAEAVEARFGRAWQFADIKLSGSCFLLPNKQ